MLSYVMLYSTYILFRRSIVPQFPVIRPIRVVMISKPGHSNQADPHVFPKGGYPTG